MSEVDEARGEDGDSPRERQGASARGGEGEERAAPPAAQQDDWSPRHILSYVIGCLVSANALRDVFLVVDGPDCIYHKTQFIQGNQDYASALVNVAGYHKASHTGLRCADNVVRSRETDLEETLTRIAQLPEAGAVLLTSMPMATILGIDYERICERVEAQTGKPVIAVQGRSLSSDWLGAYMECQRAIAGHLTLPEVATAPDDVAIVGLLFDRNEEDTRGNVRELRRLLEALGLRLAGVWLDGGDYADLAKIATASTVVSLPYGRRAASRLARRLGARLVETELPFGLGATERWVRQVAEATGRQAQAEALIDRELRVVVPKLEWVVPFVFQGRRIGYAGDPILLPGFLEILELVGARAPFAAVTNVEEHMKGVDVEGKVDHLWVCERLHTLADRLREHATRERVDCVVTNNTCFDFLVPTHHAIVEFGFPSYSRHALYDRPYLGFGGFLAFLDTLATEMRFFGAVEKRFGPTPRDGED